MSDAQLGVRPSWGTKVALGGHILPLAINFRAGRTQQFSQVEADSRFGSIQVLEAAEASWPSSVWTTSASL
jgi:hypothetical protein